MTDIFVVEEHHEAFFIWNYAILKQIISDRQNTLLHVDEHADMNLPTLQTSLKEVRPDLRTLFSFTWNQLSIAEFILPAIYQGIFNEIFWMRRDHKLLAPEKTLNVVSEKGEGRTLFVTDNFLRAGIFNPDRKAAVYRQIRPDKSLAPSGPVVLDIDLDYFYCDYNTGEMYELQVTENAYKDFISNPYHKLRITAGTKMRVEEREGQYYFIYQSLLVQDQPEIDRDKISERIAQFVNWLQENDIRPVLIDICRSRFSGYTPEEHWKWIEELLLQQLCKLFPVNITHFSDLIDEEHLT